jgi:chorismate-pyruvate lyase
MTGLEPAMMREGILTHRDLVAANLDYKALSPLLRTLLTTDGTVTEVLAAFFGEDVGIHVLGQGYRAYEGRANRELEAELGTRMLDRSIVLLGRSSGTPYAAAFSRIIPSLLPLGMQEALLAEREPLGKLMLQYRLETFKEIVACGRCRADEAPMLADQCPTALDMPGAAPVVWRTYRVLSQGKAVMSITEIFPERLQ